MNSNGILPIVGFLNTEGDHIMTFLSESYIDVTSMKRHVRVCESVIVENEKKLPVDVLVLRSKTGTPEAQGAMPQVGE